jgi:exodeoxyribonuclease VII small subunit
LIEEIQKIQNKNERIIKMATSNFEKNMSDLENIVTELEKGDLNLDESISKFEEGIKISKQCNKILEDAEKKITILLEKDGEVKEENFVSEE